MSDTDTKVSIEEQIAYANDCIHAADAAEDDEASAASRAILASLRQFAQMERDARRYKYLRGEGYKDFTVQHSFKQIWCACSGPYMDEAIDMAIARDKRNPT